MIDDPAARAHVAAVWGVDPAIIPGKGKPAVELLDSLGREDGPRALLVHGANVRVSAPNANHVGDRLDALECWWSATSSRRRRRSVPMSSSRSSSGPRRRAR